MGPFRRAWLAAALVAACAAVAPPAFASETSPTRAPAFALPGRSGTVQSDSLHARALVVDFWASWCVPCRESFPWLARLQQQYGDSGLVIVAVNLDKERAPADAFLAHYPAPFRVAFDPEGKTAEAYRVSGMPSTYLVGPDGAIILSHAGFDVKSARAFETRIARMLAP